MPLLFSVLLLSLSAPQEKAKARLTVEPAVAAAGTETRLTCEIEIESGWHLYAHDFEGTGVATTLAATLPEGFALGPWSWPASQRIQAFGQSIRGYEGKLSISAPLRIGAAAKPGKREVAVLLKYQSCNDRVCVDGKAELSAPIEVKGSAADPLEGRIEKGPESYPITPTFELSKKKLAPEEEALLTIRLRIGAGWHTYAPTSPEGGGMPLALKAEGFALLGSLEGPEPTPLKDTNFNLTTLVYEGEAELKQKVRLAGEAKPTVTLTGMVCNDRQCMPPGKWVASFDVERVPGVAPPSLPESPAPPKSVVQGSLAPFLATAASAGAFSLLTPCVFPMIPITISFFSKRTSGSRRRTVALATSYVAGIVLTFTAIGIAVAGLFGAAGLQNLATNVWMNLGLGLLFVVLGLSLLGLFQFQAPVGLLNKVEAARASAKSDLALTLLMAVAFTLSSFTCTLPFVAAVLGAAAGGDYGRPVLGMLTYSAVFAAPFFFLALFPTLLQRLPKGGSWLESVKVSMGFVELAAALKFLSNSDIGIDSQVLTRPVFLALWIALFGALALYLFGLLRLPGGAVEEIGALRAMFGVGSLALALYLVTGLFGARYGLFLEAFLPPPGYGGVATARIGDGAPGPSLAHFHEDDLEGGLAQAKAENKRIFFNFTGYQCTNCRAMEGSVFPRPDVQSEFKNYVLIELHTDAQSPPEKVALSERFQRLQQKLVGHLSQPYYVITEPDGETVVAEFKNGFARNETEIREFVDFLRAGRSEAALRGSAPR